MNAFIEERVLEMPEQYFWAHKRFKTRPPGERSPYEKGAEPWKRQREAT
jgi:KDO2-lipid IV(A) lauroyltransferase